MFQSPARSEAFTHPPKVQDDRFILPGYGLPLDYAPVDKNVYGIENRALFPTSLDDRDIAKGYADQPILTLREIGLIKVMEHITDRASWYQDVFNTETAEKWKKEAMESKNDISPNMANWMIEELRYKAIIYHETHVLALYNGDVVKSDKVIPEQLRIQFKEALIALEADRVIGYFPVPGTNDRVADVVSGSLFPLVYGRSRILPNKIIGLDDALDAAREGEIIPAPHEKGITREDIAWRVVSRSDISVKPYSTTFQMLPCDMFLGEDNRWHISSYINNLHPVRHRTMYNIIEDIFNRLVPLWNATLTPLKDMLHSRPRIEYHNVEYHPLPPEVEARRPQKSPGEAEFEYQEKLQKWKNENYRVVQPDVGRFQPWAVPPWMMDHLPKDLPNPVRIEQGVELNNDYCKRGLQVFVRLVQISLTPEDPEVSGDWHVEGQLNEHICAVATYPFDIENVDDTRITVRQIADTSYLAQVEHDPEDVVWLKQVFGFEPGEPANQEVGHVELKSGRVVVFPSTLQHRIGPWRLKDRSKTGYIKSLIFHLVDPNIRIISTANIPPQRVDWGFQEEEMEQLNQTLERFSIEVQDRMLARRDKFPFTVKEGMEFREELVKERIRFTKYQQVAFESRLVYV